MSVDQSGLIYQFGRLTPSAVIIIRFHFHCLTSPGKSLRGRVSIEEGVRASESKQSNSFFQLALAILSCVAFSWYPASGLGLRTTLNGRLSPLWFSASWILRRFSFLLGPFGFYIIPPQQRVEHCQALRDASPKQAHRLVSLGSQA